MSQFDKTNAIFGFSTLKNPQFRSNFFGNKFSVDQCNQTVIYLLIKKHLDQVFLINGPQPRGEVVLGACIAESELGNDYSHLSHKFTH